MKASPTLLTDAQVRSFIANGFLRIAPDVPAAVHAEVEAQLRYVEAHETRYGNNILARVPQMYEVLECPAVRGALASLAGPDYYLHPHRAVHSSTPLEDGDAPRPAADANAPRMGKGSMAGSGWHQDAQSPLARARHHTPRFLIGFYFPHETPVAMGPTRVQGGSHLYAHPVAPHGVVLESVPAGSFFVLHFDMVHAGFPNHLAQTRYMVKFVFARTRPPAAPSWQHADPAWQRPDDCIPTFDLPATWGYIWHWLRGERPEPSAGEREGAPLASREPSAGEREGAPLASREPSAGEREGAPLASKEPTRTDASRHIAHFDSADQAERLEAIHLAAGGDVDALATALLAHAGQNKHCRRLAKDANGAPLPRDDTSDLQRRWTERAVVMEDAAYALAAAGERARPALAELLAHEDPWLQVNAAFALGEMGASAADAVPALARLLDSPHQVVVRQALDALSAVGTGLAPVLPRLERLLRESNPAWQEPQVGRGWTGEDQVRMNAAELLLCAATAGEALPTVERIASGALGDKNGYVSAIAVDALQRIGTPSANAAALEFLARRRWDDTLRGRAKAY